MARSITIACDRVTRPVTSPISGDRTFTTLDGTFPSLSVTAPAAGATVSGTVAVTANASDNVGVVGVQFKLDGANLGTEDTTAPYSMSWNTTSTSNGSHTLTAVARDAAGNSDVQAVAVTVYEHGPPPTGLWPNEPGGFTVIEETGWESEASALVSDSPSADKPINVGSITIRSLASPGRFAARLSGRSRRRRRHRTALRHCVAGSAQ